MEIKCAMINHFVGAGPPHFTAGRFKGVDQSTNQSVVVRTSRAARGGGGSFKNRKPIGKIRCCESQMSDQKH